MRYPGNKLAFLLKLGASGVWIGQLLGVGFASMLLFFRFFKKNNELKYSINTQIKEE